jgi:magnesium transporter
VGRKRIEKPRLELISYNEEGFSEADIEQIDNIRSKMNENMVSWINVCGIHDAGLMARIGDVFGIHPLVMEDIMNTDQRPKVELHPDYLFTVVKMVKKGNEIEQVSLILGRNFVLSFQEWKGDVFDPVRDRIRTKRGKIRSMGADYLAYALIDSVVDNFFPVLEEIGDAIEELEEKLNKNADDRSLKRIHSLKRKLIQLRRSIWPMRDVVNSLIREDSPYISEEIKPYLRDVYDHAIQVMDSLESQRDMATGLMDLYISLVSNRMNEIMKVLTIIATIFIPLTFIAGIYLSLIHI